MIEFGDIVKIEGNKAFVEVKAHETTYECYMLQPLTGAVKIDMPYTKGDQVACILQNGRNLIIGAIYNDIDERPEKAEDKAITLESEKFNLKTEKETDIEAEKVKMKTSGCVMEIKGNEIIIDANKVTFNGGTNLGFIKIAQLVARMNLIESAFNAHTHLIIIPLPGNPTSNSPMQLSPTVQAQIENPKITH